MECLLAIDEGSPFDSLTCFACAIVCFVIPLLFLVTACAAQVVSSCEAWGEVPGALARWRASQSTVPNASCVKKGLIRPQVSQTKRGLPFSQGTALRAVQPQSRLMFFSKLQSRADSGKGRLCTEFPLGSSNTFQEVIYFSRRDGFI